MACRINYLDREAAARIHRNDDVIGHRVDRELRVGHNGYIASAAETSPGGSGSSAAQLSETHKIALASCGGKQLLPSARAAITTVARGNISLQMAFPDSKVEAFAVEKHADQERVVVNLAGPFGAVR